MFDSDKARTIISDFHDLLDKTPAEVAHTRIRPDAWTLTEIVGHLVDSASNNHQRFARLQLADLEEFPAYTAEPWVEAQKYDLFGFGDITTLWASYNKFILHLCSTAPQEALQHCWTNDKGSHSLEFLMADYYDHINLHVDHYRERLAEISG